VKLNVTAILTLEQVAGVAQMLNPQVPAIVSVFGVGLPHGCDPEPIMRASLALLANLPKAELLWAVCARFEHIPSEGRLPHRDRTARRPQEGHQAMRAGARRGVSGYSQDVSRRRPSRWITV